MSDKQWVFDNPQEAADLIEQQQQRIVELELHLKSADAFNSKLALHCDALAATVEHLHDKFTKASTWEDVREAFAATPQQNLAEVRAKAVEDAVKSCAYIDRLNGAYWAHELRLYASQLREQSHD